MIIPLGFGLYTLSLLTFLGNAMVVHVIRAERKLRTVSNMFILSLAIADSIVGLIVMPISSAYVLTGDWIFGIIVCQFWLIIDYTASTASIFNLLILSLDRYWSIKSPLKYLCKRTKKRALAMIVMVWLLAGCWILPIIGWHHWYNEGYRKHDNQVCETEFSNDKLFKVTTSVLNFVIPMSLMVILYIKIYLEIKRRGKFDMGVCGGRSKDRSTMSSHSLANCVNSDNQSLPTLIKSGKLRLNWKDHNTGSISGKTRLSNGPIPDSLAGNGKNIPETTTTIRTMPASASIISPSDLSNRNRFRTDNNNKSHLVPSASLSSATGITNGDHLPVVLTVNSGTIKRTSTSIIPPSNTGGGCPPNVRTTSSSCCVSPLNSLDHCDSDTVHRYKQLVVVKTGNKSCSLEDHHDVDVQVEYVELSEVTDVIPVKSVCPSSDVDGNSDDAKKNRKNKRKKSCTQENNVNNANNNNSNSKKAKNKKKLKSNSPSHNHTDYHHQQSNINHQNVPSNKRLVHQPHSITVPCAIDSELSVSGPPSSTSGGGESTGSGGGGGGGGGGVTVRKEVKNRQKTMLKMLKDSLSRRSSSNGGGGHHSSDSPPISRSSSSLGFRSMTMSHQDDLSPSKISFPISTAGTPMGPLTPAQHQPPTSHQPAHFGPRNPHPHHHHHHHHHHHGHHHHNHLPLKRSGSFSAMSSGSFQDHRSAVHRVESSRLRQEKKAARQLGVILGAFILCWLPYVVVFIVTAYCSCVNHFVHTMAIWLGYINSTINPFLYALCNENFKQAFRKRLARNPCSSSPESTGNAHNATSFKFSKNNYT
ncbi:uncharacterized protein LOC141852132 isoform X2 [Brevipalpus obovatus]